MLRRATTLQSAVHAVWPAIFLAANLVAIPLVEEPRLRARFGEAYATYCRQVPRVVPQWKPWDPDLSSRVDASAV